MPIPVPGLAAQPAVKYQAGLQTAPFPAVRPPEINAGDGEPEERQVASAGDCLPDGAAFVVHSQPTVPIDDFMEEVVGRRQAAQQFAGVRIDENCILAAEIDDN